MEYQGRVLSSSTSSSEADRTQSSRPPIGIAHALLHCLFGADAHLDGAESRARAYLGGVVYVFNDNVLPA